MSPEPFNRLQKIYIGQTQNPIQRLEQHSRTKDWWTKAIIFNYNDNNVIFDRSIVQYLEYLLIKTVIECNMCQLMENCQIPNEPIIRASDKIFAYEVFEYIIMLLKFSGHHFCDNKIYDLNRDNHIKTNKRTIIKRLADEMNRHIEQDDYYDEDAEESCTYLYNTPDNSCYATVIPINDKFMLLFGRLSPDVNLNELSDEIRNKIDLQTRQLKRDIMCDSIDDVTFILTGKREQLNWIKQRNL